MDPLCVSLVMLTTPSTQAVQNLSTLQNHQRSLIASSEASAAQLTMFHMERDTQHRTSEERVTAAAQAATASLAERQAVSAGALHAQEVKGTAS